MPFSTENSNNIENNLNRGVRYCNVLIKGKKYTVNIYEMKMLMNKYTVFLQREAKISDNDHYFFIQNYNGEKIVMDTEFNSILKIINYYWLTTRSECYISFENFRGGYIVDLENMNIYLYETKYKLMCSEYYTVNVPTSLRKIECTKVPDNLKCPITLDFFEDPVVTCDGHSYSRWAICKWFMKSRKSPMTDLELQSTVCFPNNVLKNLVDDFLILA
mgnify:CR=1 FL=1|tara:strand:- start:239 stop:889 length:651 start_codon:yes stop_codon:yes gene_type:complete